MAQITIAKILECTKGTLLKGEETVVVKGFSVNSNKINNGDMFIPTIGERTNGHKYIDSALNNGAVATLTSEDIKNYIDGKVYIKVNDTLKAFQDIAAYMREQLPLPVVGVTGSVGKTTTKEMIAAALGIGRNTFKTEGNMNSQIGLSMMMTKLEKEHTAAVIEMGVSEPDEMDNLSRIAKPDFYVMTNIGVSHIGQFGSKENILKEKANIINGFEIENSKSFAYDLKDINCLFVNGDDEQLRKIADYKKYLNEKNAEDDNAQNVTAQSSTVEDSIVDEVDCPLSDKTKKALEKTKVITYGIDSKCDFRAVNIMTVKGQVHFDVAYRDKMEHIILNVLGRHNIYNALVAIAVARCFNIKPIDSKIGLFEYEPMAMRGTIEEHKGIKIIDDTYNASPDSMKSGVDVLLAVEGVEKRVAVLADILELGEKSYECHYEVGEYLTKKKIDEVVVIGKEAKAIEEAIKNDKECSIVTHSFDSNEEANAYLDGILGEKVAVLIKGSRGMHTDEIVEHIKSR